MKIKILLAACCFLFILPKFMTTGIRMSDSNIYFYTAYELLHGKLLYKDIFFTNFPFLPYISMLYFLLVFGKLQLYYITSGVEAMITALLLYAIVKKQYANSMYAYFTSLLYLFSFIVLSTSDHQTGVFTASLFGVLGYYLTLRKKYLWAGVSLGIMLMTKAYFLPVFLAMALSLFFQRSEKLSPAQSSRFSRTIPFLAGAAGSILLILLPSLLLAPQGLWHDVFVYSLTRSQGVSKMNIIWFFIKHDFLLFCLFLYSLMTVSKNLFLGLVSILGLFFFILYKDIYYLYLNFLIPFVCLSLPALLKQTKQLPSQVPLIVTVLVLFLGSNYLIYATSYATLGRVSDITPLVKTIIKTHPAVLYGMNDITPALAYLTHTPLLNNIVDTNENIYRKGFLHASSLTHEAITRKAMLVAHGVSYPEQGIKQSLVGEIFDQRQIAAHCTLLEKAPVKTEGIENRITLFSCR